MPVQELDRVLDREDVLVSRPVDVVQERCERRRLAGAGRARDEHETTRLVGKLVQPLRHVELFERADPRRDQAERSREAFPLEVRVDAEPGEPRHRVREVELSPRFQVLLLVGRDDAVDERPRLVRVELLELCEPLEATVDADDGRRAGRQVKVGRIAFDHYREKFVNGCECRLSCSSVLSARIRASLRCFPSRRRAASDPRRSDGRGLLTTPVRKRLLAYGAVADAPVVHVVFVYQWVVEVAAPMPPL